MAEDEDIGRSLPVPPPPSPARRETAIHAALRRFDGAADAPPAAGKPPPPRWRASRPQLGALLAASLALLVGVPLAMQTADRPSAGSDAEVASAADVARREVAPPPLVAEAAPPATAAPQVAQADAPPAAVAATATAESKAVAPPAVQTARSEAAAAPPPAEYAAAAPSLVAPPPAIAPAAPPPPPAAAPEARSAVAVRDSAVADLDVVVTGARAARRPPAGSDADACTIADPRRQLDLCRGSIDPGAPGREGRAAARITDALSRAWQGDLGGAATALDQAIAVAPRSSLAYLNRGLIWERRGDLDRAIADLERAVEYAPNSAQPLYQRSRLLRRRGEAERAEADRKRAVELDSRY